MNFLSQLARLAQIDKGTFFSVLSKAWNGVAGVISLTVIAKTMSADVQGFYFTFASLLALQIVLELGFSYVLVQFSAHEFALSRKHADERIREQAYSRLIGILRLSLKWYAGTSIIFLIACSITGEIFFRTTYSGDPGQWQVPWLLAVAAASGYIMLIPVYAILDGSNEIAAVAKSRAIQDLIGYSVFWLILLAGGGLFAVAGLHLGRIVGGLAGLRATGLMHRFRGMLRAVSVNAAPISWRKEIFPFQWKIALSWLSGYFIFQLFSPVLFAAQGAKVAGQAGMTIAIYSGVNTVMLTWVTSKGPRLCEFIALRDWARLNDLFRRTVVSSAVVIGGGLVTLTSLLIVGREHLPTLSGRLLENDALICFALVAFANHFISSIAVYVRAFKEEPMLVPSIVGAISTSILVVELARYSALAVAVGYCISTFVLGLPWSIKILLDRRRSLHILAAS